MAMHKNRLLFRKYGRAVYISHLDLMACFQRAFLRSEVKVWQTEGFNRHVYVAIALPLSVGYTSDCEILEFNLEDDIPLSKVPERLNAALPEGIEVLQCYEAKVPLKKIVDLGWEVTLEYDNGVPQGAAEALRELLSRESHIIRKPSKKAKRGYTELDLIPMVKEWSLEEAANRLLFRARIAAQNPGLNPSLILDAFAAEHPDFRPDFARFHRREVYGELVEVFR
jgi:radical SAM-linked protein